LHVGGEVGRRRVFSLDLERPAAEFHHLALQRTLVGQPGHPLADQWRTAPVVDPGQAACPFFMQRR
jgi:hypothetical protein